MLKTLLASFVESAFTNKKEWIGSQAFYANSILLSADRSVSAWSDIFTGTATANGYLIVSGRSTQENSSLSFGAADILAFITFPFVGAACASFVPVKKGDGFTVSGAFADSINIRFLVAQGSAS